MQPDGFDKVGNKGKARKMKLVCSQQKVNITSKQLLQSKDKTSREDQ